MPILKELFKTEKQRTAAKDLLKRAKEDLAERRTDCFVCFVVDDAARCNSSDQIIAAAIIDEICARIHPCSFVSTWLEWKHGISRRDMTFESRKSYRLLWIDSLIAELD